MSIPLYNVEDLWQKSRDDFNGWRATNDLPSLYDFFLAKLPDFEMWSAEFQIDRETFSHTIPTGKLFLDGPVLTLVRGSAENTSFYHYIPVEMDPDQYAHVCTVNKRNIPEMKTVRPYLAWGAARFRKKAFIPNDNAMCDSIVFNSWSAPDSPQFSRASIFRTFSLLKLGGVCVSWDVSGRNLDFADLDHLRIEGDYHASRSTFIQFSSCRELAITSAHLAFYEFRCSYMGHFLCAASKLYKVKFIECDQLETEFRDSKLNHVRFERTSVSFDFDHCELIDVVYAPSEIKRFYSSAVEIYRQLRIAYQGCGKRHEAAEAYYEERHYERKALASPYYEIEWERRFPPRKFGDKAGEILDRWRSKTYDHPAAIRRMVSVLNFHARVWLDPRYTVIAARFKIRYLASLIESLVWGYGERPGRIFVTALIMLSGYSLAYRLLLSNHMVDCIYLSLVTFTTLGYGDILPKTDLAKILCGSEALLGAFVLGLFVAGFANRSRY